MEIIKDKPESMSVREWLTKKVAMTLMTPENIVKRVISHQFNSAHDALENNNSVEISGFGKFYYNKKRVDSEIKHYEKEKASYKKVLESSTTTEEKRWQAESQLKWVNKQLNYLYKKNGKIK